MTLLAQSTRGEQTRYCRLLVVVYIGVCVYVYMYVYMYVYVCVCIYIYIYIYAYTHIIQGPCDALGAVHVWGINHIRFVKHC